MDYLDKCVIRLWAECGPAQMQRRTLARGCIECQCIVSAKPRYFERPRENVDFGQMGRGAWATQHPWRELELLNQQFLVCVEFGIAAHNQHAAVGRGELDLGLVQILIGQLLDTRVQGNGLPPPKKQEPMLTLGSITVGQFLQSLTPPG